MGERPYNSERIRELRVSNLARWMVEDPVRGDRYWLRQCAYEFGLEGEAALRMVKAARERFLEQRGQLRLV